MDETIDSIRYSDNEGMNALRTLLGVLSIILTMICCVCCLYKYAVCQEKKEKQNRTYINVQSSQPKLSQVV
tara:strand:- start:32 stop:244 length:213 start_codon:yes stop_codon:yes gene_type:complete